MMRPVLLMGWLALASVLAGCGTEAPPGARFAPEVYPAPSAMATSDLASDQGGVELVEQFNTEAYDRIYENPFLAARSNPFSTFSIDVDTASYSNVRRFLNQGQLPPADAVRIEELVNYFPYDYPAPDGELPFSAHVEVAACPWNAEHRLARIGLKGKAIEQQDRAVCNLVFLLDVSGSMASPNKLPLLKSAMKMLVQNLTEQDHVAIVVYAGAAGLVLPSTSCSEKETILSALDRLEAGGSTNGGEGIQLAYRTAKEHFVPSGVNRVILCTDGDFNVGTTSQGELIRMMEEKAREGVFLSILGFGMGNYKDSTLENLTNKGNGNYAYIDTIHEARKVLVEQMDSTLITIAKDVKIQVDFNPARVGAYRLLGYENRMLRTEDFHDDTKDAGEIGAGHTVTALYELVPAGKEMDLPPVDASKYQQPGELSPSATSDELFTVKLRYKHPQADTSQLLSIAVSDDGKPLVEASSDFQFAAAVAAFGMLLRDSEHKGTSTYDLVMELAEPGRGSDPGGYRTEFLQLVKTAKALGHR
jgi:Ca-activated chloride channel homolog